MNKPFNSSKFNNGKQVKQQEQLDLSQFEFITTWNDEEEWYKWDEIGKSVSGWIVEFTRETFGGRDEDVVICHMVIDYENMVRLDEMKHIKFPVLADLQRKFDKLSDNILGKFDEYRVFIKLEEVRRINETKSVKVFVMGVKQEKIPILDEDDFIKF